MDNTERKEAATPGDADGRTLGPVLPTGRPRSRDPVVPGDRASDNPEGAQPLQGQDDRHRRGEQGVSSQRLPVLAGSERVRRGLAR